MILRKWVGMACLLGGMGVHALVAQTPVITLFQPTYGTPGDPSPVTIYVGNVENELDIREIYFNTTFVPLWQWQVTGFNGALGWQVVASIPVGATTGPIGVRTSRGQLGVSTQSFLVFERGPRPLDFTPRSGRTNETVVTITGERFVAGTQVYFKGKVNDVRATLLSSPEEDEIRALVPVGAVSGPIRLTSIEGSNATVDSFEVIQDIDLATQVRFEPLVPAVGRTWTVVASITNASSAPSTGVVLTNLLDASLTILGVSVTQGGTPTVSGGSIVWVVGNLAQHSSAEARISVLPTQAREVAMVSGVRQNEPDAVPSNNSVTNRVKVLPNQVDLALRMEAEPASPFVGAAVTFTLTATNASSLPATAVRVVDELPSSLLLQSAESSQGVALVEGSRVTAELGGLLAGSSAVVRITALVLEPGVWVNTATVTGAESDPATGNNSASLTMTSVARQADLRARQTLLPSVPVVSEVAKLQLVVSNAGPASATGVRLVSTLDTNLVLVSASATSGSVQISGQTVVATLPLLAARAESQVEVQIIAKSTQPTTNRVEVTSDLQDPQAADNVANLVFESALPPMELRVEWTSDGRVRVVWPAFPVSWRLQMGTGPRWPLTWEASTLPESVAGGERHVLVQPSQGGGQYFRLVEGL